MSGELPFTGERFVPGTRGEIWIEHWHRYHFASRWTAGRRVLDVACGEGYGTALLARGAAHVTGIDVSPEAIAHARAAYGALANAEFACASCTRLPLADASVEVAVSFETVEHIAEQEAFVDELSRVLAPGGVLLLSCPNKLEYSDRRGFANEFHVKELYRDELARLVARRFPVAEWYGQRPSFFSVIVPESRDLPPPLGTAPSGTGLKSEGRGEGSGEGRGEAREDQPPTLPPTPSRREGESSPGAQFLEVSESAPAEPAAALSSPLYFIVAAARDREALAAVAPALSVLSDRDDWVHRDYEKVMRDLEQHAARGKQLERDLAAGAAERERLAERAWGLEHAVALQEAAIEAQKTLAEDTEAAHRAELATREAEIERRRSWRWWLKLPLVRLGLIDR